MQSYVKCKIHMNKNVMCVIYHTFEESGKFTVHIIFKFETIYNIIILKC